MRYSRKAAKRLKWFLKGVEALRQARPEAPKMYYCPLCLVGYPSTDELTLEDVPPRSVGGRPLVLTCRGCNGRSGHELDYHARAGKNLREFAEGARDIRVRLAADDLKVTATMRKTSEGLSFSGLPQYCNPAHHKAFFARFEEAAGRGTADFDLGLSFVNRYDPWAENLAWLRASYLVAFAALGYTYILRPELEPLRQQLKNPGERILPFMVSLVEAAEAGLRRSIVVFEPTELRSILVQFDRRLLFLPDLTARDNFFGQLRVAAQAQSRAINFLGPELRWPTSPIFLLDFHPALIPRLQPQAVDLWKGVENR